MTTEWNAAIEAAAELCGTTAAIWSNGTLEEISSVSKAIKRAILALRRDDVSDEAVPVLEHNVQRTAPEIIYLQTGDDPLDMSISFNELMNMGDVSWCQDKIFESDVQYVRADLRPAPNSETGRDAARLDFVLSNTAWIHATETDAGGLAYQLWTSDEDENFHVLSGDAVFHKTKRKAIDAAMEGKS